MQDPKTCKAELLQVLELWQEGQQVRIHLEQILLLEEEEWDLVEECQEEVDQEEEDQEEEWLEVDQDLLRQLFRNHRFLKLILVKFKVQTKTKRVNK